MGSGWYLLLNGKNWSISLELCHFRRSFQFVALTQNNNNKIFTIENTLPKFTFLFGYGNERSRLADQMIVFASVILSVSRQTIPLLLHTDDVCCFSKCAGFSHPSQQRNKRPPEVQTFVCLFVVRAYERMYLSKVVF